MEPPGSDRPIMHFTHVDNLPSIVAAGEIRADVLLRKNQEAVRECADTDIKANRRNIPVQVPPGGSVGEYVPFYFAPRSPMLYKISRGSVRTFTGPQSELVYLVSTFNRVHAAQLPWVGSDGNCAAALTTHYNAWTDLENAVDWPLMKEKYWSNTEADGDRMRRRMAELLIYERFPLSALAGIVVMTEETKRRVAGITGSRWPAYVRQDWYY